MAEFFQMRLRTHLKQMQKYLRYVLNDHFVLICMFLLGGLGLYYSTVIKSLPEHFFYGGIILVVVWVSALHFGRFVSLMKPADLVFLLPKEAEMRQYLAKSYRYSCLVPFSFLFLIVGISMPLFVVTTGAGFGQFFLLVPTLWSLKLGHLTWQRLCLFQGTMQKQRQSYLVWVVISSGLLVSAIYLATWVALMGGLLLAGSMQVVCWQKITTSLDWEKMIAKEKNRIHRIYQFINLFTDVPEITASVKRRKYLDGLLKQIPPKQQQTYLYLYARRLLRGSEYSGLYLRLLSIGGLALYWIDDLWFSLGIGVLFLYLIGFQLLPLYSQFQYMVLTHLYPVEEAQKSQALQKLLGGLLTVTGIIFTGISWLQLANWSERGIVLVGYLVVVVGFTFWYLPTRIKKLT